MKMHQPFSSFCVRGTDGLAGGQGTKSALRWVVANAPKNVTSFRTVSGRWPINSCKVACGLFKTRLQLVWFRLFVYSREYLLEEY